MIDAGARSPGAHRGRLPVLIVPALAFYAAFFVTPIVVLFIVSFVPTDERGAMLAGLSFAQYSKVMDAAYLVRALTATPGTALEVTALCLVLGYSAALVLVSVRRRSLRVVLYLIVVAPLLTSVVVRSYGWLVILGGSGPINATLSLFGMGPIRLLYTDAAVLVAITHVLLPFMTLLVASSLQGIDDTLLRASESLGAGPIRRFVTVTLPLSLPGVAAGSLVVFVLAMGIYVTPLLVGGTQTDLGSIKIYVQVVRLFNFPIAAAISFGLLALTLIGAALLTIGFRVLSSRYSAV